MVAMSKGTALSAKTANHEGLESLAFAGAVASPGTVARIDAINLDDLPLYRWTTEMRATLLARLRAAQTNAAIGAVVLTGSRAFAGDGTIEHLDAEEELPTMADLFATIAGSSKPVIAAIRQGAHGMGLELALCCTHRVAAASSRFSMPQVRTGIIPTLGATQLLPLLVGLREAADLMILGRRRNTAAARDSGLVDIVTSGDPADVAVRLARQSLDGQAPRPVTHAITSTDLAALRRLIQSRHPGQLAPMACLEAIKQAMGLPLAEVQLKARQTALKLQESPQAAALRYLLHAERNALDYAPRRRMTAVAEIAKVGILGDRGNSIGIALCLANSGLKVAIRATTAEARSATTDELRRLGADFVRRNVLTEAALSRAMARIELSAETGYLVASDLIIDSGDAGDPEYAALTRLCPEKAIIARAVRHQDGQRDTHPARTIGMTFFAPTGPIRMVELTPTHDSAPDTIAAAIRLVERVGKNGMLLPAGSRGDIVQRLRWPFIREAIHLVDEGATPMQVDRALMAFGLLGPFGASDVEGLPRTLAHCEDALGAEPPWLCYSPTMDLMIDAGRTGLSAGTGWFAYDQDSHKPQHDADILPLLRESALAQQLRRRDISDEEIVQRCLYAAINEAMRVIGEGDVTRASDVDSLWVHALGFPRWRGGLLYHADTIGAARICEAIDQFRLQRETMAAPCPLLRAVADNAGRLTAVAAGGERA